MGGIIGNPLTALTAKILFDGTEIGALQELSIEEDFDVKPIKQIGSNIPAEFLPGTTTGRLIAQRAYLEGDLLFDKLTPSLVPGSKLADLIKDSIGNSGELNVGSITDVLEDAYDIYETLFLGRVLGERATFVVHFDVELINPQNEIFAKFRKCTLSARSMSITIGGILIMQNVTMFFGSRDV